MTITFLLHYQTVWGQEIHITGSCEQLGENIIERSLPMDYIGDGNWSLTMDFVEHEIFTYNYILLRNGNVVRHESGKPRVFSPSAKSNIYKQYDRWQTQSDEATFYTTPFSKVVYRHDNEKKKVKEYVKSVVIKVFAPTILPQHRVGIIGKGKALGNWQPEKATAMICPNFPEWEMSFDASKLELPLEYKFVVLDENDNIVLWESGENRCSLIHPLAKGERVEISGLELRNPIKGWRGAGVAIPVFSLRSSNGFGIGEFLDIKSLADWAAMTGQRFIQILPVNDTTITNTWVDSYPYKSISTDALHPIYINLESVGKLRSAADVAKFDKLKAELNALAAVDYEAVLKAKWEYLTLIFEQDGEKTLSSKEYKEFYKANKGWLAPYAAFCYLRDKHQTTDISKWGKYAIYDPKIPAGFEKKGSKTVHYMSLVYFVQFHLDKQLKEAHKYANEKGVALKGDIPIGISRFSIEAWTHPEYFNMNGQAGAPPDDFSVTGQNWGFPTYNWSKMEEDGYQWWKKRFTKMADYFDAYRIDHILGFFRIWDIPIDSVQGLLGHFSPALPFTREEIQGFGLQFDDGRFLKPFIRREFLDDFFGQYTEEVIDKYLVDKGYDIFDLKPEFDTQRKVEAYFSGKNDEKSLRIHDGLWGLINEVLFIRDPKMPHTFHPRISAQLTYSYKYLNNYEKESFNRLYNHFFYERHTDFWKWEALKKLPALIHATDMLVCGEDLGMIPASVPDVMNQLKILSLEIQRMPKNPQLLFGDTRNYPYLSVCTTSTHDMSTIRGWWEEDKNKIQAFYNIVLHEYGEAPAFCEPWICNRIIDMHLESPSILCILPLQDYLSIDAKLRRKDPDEERINVPANPRNYWRYRMHITLDKLIASSEFNKLLKDKMIYFNRAK